MATKVQLINGAFQDVEGNALASGYLEFVLNQDETVPGSGNLAANIAVTIQLDSNGNVQTTPAQYIWPNDVMQPANSFYKVTGYTAKGQLAWGPNFQQVLSTPNPFDLGSWIPNRVSNWEPSPQHLLVEVNGIPNVNQSVLNFKDSSTVGWTDNGDGSVSATSTQPAGVFDGVFHFVTVQTDPNSTIQTIGGPAAQPLGTAANVPPTGTVAGHRSYTSAATASTNISAGIEVNAGAFTSTSSYSFGTIQKYICSLRMNNTTNCRYWIGVGEIATSDWTGPSNAYATDTPNRNYAAFRFSSTTDSTIKAVVGTSSAQQTVVNTGVSVNTSVPQRFQIAQTGSSYKFYINGALVSEISSTLPAASTRCVPFWCSDNKNTATAVGAGFLLHAGSRLKRAENFMQTIYYTGVPGTRERVIAAYGNGSLIGWKLRGNAGVVFNLAYTTDEHLSIVPDVASVLNAIGGNSILVHGNAGISIAAGISQSTHLDQDSDCLVEHELIGNFLFTSQVVVIGG